MGYKEIRQLLCTFSTDQEYKKIAFDIKKFYNFTNDKIFVFSNEKNNLEYYLTYNVFNEKKIDKFPNTILIHRKKQTNTLYTLNSMNRLIEEENGSFDKSYILDWKLYSNSLILTNEISVRIIPLKIVTVL